MHGIIHVIDFQTSIIRVGSLYPPPFFIVCFFGVKKINKEGGGGKQIAFPAKEEVGWWGWESRIAGSSVYAYWEGWGLFLQEICLPG